jgi:hypothetical protein
MNEISIIFSEFVVGLLKLLKRLLLIIDRYLEYVGHRLYGKASDKKHTTLIFIILILSTLF